MGGFVGTEICATAEGRAWVELRFSLRPLDLSEIALGAATPGERRGSLNAVLRALDHWTAAGLIHRMKTGKEQYLMTDDARKLRQPPAAATRPIRKEVRSGRARMWTAIRVLKSFDLVELCSAAECARNSAAAYMRMLERGGYVTRISARGELPRWRLIRHSGPKNPGVVRDPLNRNHIVALVDRNTGERHPLANRHGQPSFFLDKGIHHVC